MDPMKLEPTGVCTPGPGTLHTPPPQLLPAKAEQRLEKNQQEKQVPVCVHPHLVTICFYLSLGVNWQRLISGTDVTPQRLYCPSPMERDTSSTPKTRPSLKWGTMVDSHLTGHGPLKVETESPQ